MSNMWYGLFICKRMTFLSHAVVKVCQNGSPLSREYMDTYENIKILVPQIYIF